MKLWQRWWGGDSQIYMQKLVESLLAMAWFVEARDPYTGGHLWRVSRFSRLLADEAGLNVTDAARVSLGGFLHDLGKVGIPDAILRKPGHLTDDEFELIRTHPDIGVRMLAGHPLAPLVRDAVGKHHERPDGKGYPHGLTGDDIPLDARIVGICDAFDAMTSHRPYRAGMPEQTALSILRDGAGEQFDAELAPLFVRLGRQRKLTDIIGHSDDGIPLQSCPMCGPTLVVRYGQSEGEQIFCRNCAGEFVLDQALKAQPTGRNGRAVDLEPEPDTELIARTVRGIASVLPLANLIQQSVSSS